MKPIIKSLVFIALAIFATSCEREEAIEKLGLQKASKIVTA